MEKVSIAHVKKVYDNGVVAVDDFNLSIRENEFVVLVGPSGCGKSTLLRMIAGLEEISGGIIKINDRIVNNVQPKDRDIAMVFQNYALYPHMTVYENMAFGLRQRREARDVIDKKVREAAETLGLTHLLERKPKVLSGGQRQRVAIGRAIVREPQVFLMDEPLSNLDAKLRNQMRAELIKLRNRVNTTFIYVTHDQTEAMTLGDRIVIMRDGLIQQIGTPMQLYDHPKNLFVAGFVGMPQMNFLEGELIVENGQVRVLLNEEVELPLTEQVKEELSKGESKKMVVGIRPEHLSVVPQDTEGAFTGKLIVHELMGNEIHLHLDFLGTELILRLPTLNLQPGYEKALWREQEIPFVLHKEAIHLFDAETEVSLTTFTGDDE